MEKYLKAQDVCKAFADYIWSPLPRTISYASSFVEKIPSADAVEVRHGRWIDTDNYYQRWKCSVCGCHTRDEAPNFCSNCGAKMDLEGESANHDGT